MFEDGGDAICLDGMVRFKYDLDDIQTGRIDPVLKPLPMNRYADGILVPKMMKDPDHWEPMGDPEYRALYYALCKFNQMQRSGVEYKSWGNMPDEIIYSYPDTTPYYFMTLQIFFHVFGNVCGPTARKIVHYRDQDESRWLRLSDKLREIAGGNGENPVLKKITVKQFMEMSKHWRRAIGIPRDIHAAFADFVPGTCNVFRLRDCAVMYEYDSRLASIGGDAVGEGITDVANDPTPEVPRGPCLPCAAIFPGDGSQRVGMLKDVAHLPRVKEKLAIAEKVLGFDLLDLCVNGPAAKLESLEYNGVAMYMAGWAAYEKMLVENADAARRLKAVAGIDAGEYVALSVAGVFSFEVGLEFVLARGRAMDELFKLCPAQATCSVAGLIEDRVRRLCELALATVGDDASVCQITTVLFNKGYVVGGHRVPVEAFINLAKQDSALQVKILPGLVANRTPLMQPAQWGLKAKLREHLHKIRVPWCDVYFNAETNCYLKANGEGDDQPLEEVKFAVVRFLCESCWSTLRWDKTIQSMIGRGVTHFYECGPTKQLKALMKRVNKEAFENTTTYAV